MVDFTAEQTDARLRLLEDRDLIGAGEVPVDEERRVQEGARGEQPRDAKVEA